MMKRKLRILLVALAVCSNGCDRVSMDAPESFKATLESKFSYIEEVVVTKGFYKGWTVRVLSFDGKCYRVKLVKRDDNYDRNDTVFDIGEDLLQNAKDEVRQSAEVKEESTSGWVTF